MLPNLSGTDLDDYLDTLRSSHLIRVHLDVLDSDDNLVARYDEQDLPILGGQVDVDADSAITRQLRLELANTNESATDAGDPRSALSAERQLRVIYGVFVRFRDGSSDWVEMPVFTGPITRVERNSDTVNVEAQSKEAYLLPPNRLQRSVVPNEETTRVVTVEDGERTVTIEAEHKLESYYAGDLIKRIAKRHGETRLAVPRTNRKLPEDAKLFDKATQETGAWPLMQAIAGAQQLFYDGSGRLTLRTQRRRSPAYVFNDGTNGEVLNVPTVEWDMTLFRNTLELRAFQKKQRNEKENPTLRVVVRLEPSHPLSPRSLQRNGQPRELLQVVSTEDVYASGANATHDAKTLLDRLAANAQTVQFDCLPIPHLEPGDLCALDLEGQKRVTFSARKFSLPLTPASMALGYTRRVGRR